MPRVTITVPDRTSQPYRFQLDRDVVTLGRGEENDIAIDSGSVSVNHAEMHRIPGGYELRDVGSTNGIKLDGDRYEIIPLRNGQAVTIGDVAFDFILSEDELAVLTREKAGNQLPPVDSIGANPVSKPVPKRSTYVPTQSNNGVGAGAMILFLVLAALAFFVGLAIRHQKETGKSLIDSITNRPAAEAPAKAAPATP